MHILSAETHDDEGFYRSFHAKLVVQTFAKNGAWFGWWCACTGGESTDTKCRTGARRSVRRINTTVPIRGKRACDSAVWLNAWWGRWHGLSTYIRRKHWPSIMKTNHKWIGRTELTHFYIFTKIPIIPIEISSPEYGRQNAKWIKNPNTTKRNDNVWKLSNIEILDNSKEYFLS